MKILLFISKQSSLSYILREIFLHVTNEIEVIDYLEFLPNYFHKLLDKSGQLPKFVEAKIQALYFSQIQNSYWEIINIKKPDLIFIYNDQMLSIETLNRVRKKCKLGIYLADSPLFLKNRLHIINLIIRADAVFAPDTYWLDQCKMLGVKRTQYLIPGFNETHNQRIEPTYDQKTKYGADIFFLGSPYSDTWGFKRALFLSKFCEFDFRFLGPGSWKKWFGDFPELKSKFEQKNGYLSDEELNVIMNCCKIIPVDANPGIINGFHIRVLDTIASGALPLVEYRKDIDTQFKDTPLPVIKNYNEIPKMVKYFLDNEETRRSTVEELREIVLSRYTIESASRIIRKSLDL